MVVLPVPGPPVMTSTLSVRAAATALGLLRGQGRAALLLDLIDEVFENGAAGGSRRQ